MQGPRRYGSTSPTATGWNFSSGSPLSSLKSISRTAIFESIAISASRMTGSAIFTIGRRCIICIARCFVNGAALEKEGFGSLGVFAAKTQGWHEQFDYGDLVEAQTMLLRLGDVVLITTFDDAGGALQGAMPRLERIEGALSEVQAREVMVDYAFMNLSLEERPRFYTECDIKNETLSEKAKMPPHFELGELDYKLRGRL